MFFPRHRRPVVGQRFSAENLDHFVGRKVGTPSNDATDSGYSTYDVRLRAVQAVVRRRFAVGDVAEAYMARSISSAILTLT